MDEVGAQLWWTLGSYFRGQVLVALFDAVFIGLGLLLLGVPLALPLAVLVALADSGLSTALAVLVLIVVVQQVESNILEPVT